MVQTQNLFLETMLLFAEGISQVSAEEQCPVPCFPPNAFRLETTALHLLLLRLPLPRGYESLLRFPKP